MANRSLTEFERTTAEAGHVELDRDDGQSLDRAIFHNDASFEALLVELAASGETPAVPLPRAGEVIAGKYRVEEQLGQGGMGVIYRATHLISGKQVALKWMLSAWSDTRARTRFVREARAAARIDHRNVVDVYDIGQDGDRGLYMVMQLLRGESLAKRLSRGRLGIEETVELLLPAMRGVAAVHAAGVIHRDLKPDNIFLCEAPPGLRDDAKVLDFGISAVSAQEDADQTLTCDGALVGTLAYMSPEQIQDSRAVDERTDVYSFGVILYEALTGRQPFVAASHNALVVAILAGNPEDPRVLRADLPAALAGIVLRALSKNRADRFPNVGSLIEALSAHELYAIPRERTGTAVGRTTMLSVGAMASVLILTLGAWWWSASRATPIEKVTATQDAPVQSVVGRPAPVPAQSTDSPETSRPPAPSLPETTEPSLRTVAAPAAATPPPTSARSGQRAGLRRTKSATRSSAPGANVKPLPAAAAAAGVTARSGKIAFEEL